MKCVDVIKYCLKLNNVKQIPSPNSANTFSLEVNGIPFAYFETAAPIQWQFILHVDEENAEQLYNPPQIRRTDDKGTGYWIVISRVENFDSDQLKKLINWSYDQAVSAAAVV